MKALLTKAARSTLHRFGGLSAIRHMRRDQFRVAMFHGFPESTTPTLASLCAHITRYYEPVSLSTILAAMRGERTLPPNAITITVDDGYRDFLLHGQSEFRRWRIPSTVYVVSGFSDGRLWLWTDQVRFALEQSSKTSIEVAMQDGQMSELDLSSPELGKKASVRLTEWLKSVPNEHRVEFLRELPRLTGVEIPPTPPPCNAPLSWDELRSLAAEGVEIGCHTDTHPILSRLRNGEQRDREIAGAKELIERRLGFTVKHFCYPNGLPQDIDDAVVESVRKAGFESSVTCSYGLNTLHVDPLLILRVPLDSELDLAYSMELLAGLHM